MKKEKTEGDPDVEMLDKTIPEVTINETSFDDANLKSDDDGAKATKEPDSSGNDAQFDEDPLLDLVVVDDADDVTDLKPDTVPEVIPNLKTEEVVKDEATTDPSPLKLVHCAIRQSLSSENFVIQLDNTDALNSYLDKPTCPKNEGDMKENDTNLLNVPVVAESEKVCDALILTADEELETEMSTGVTPKISDESVPVPKLDVIPETATSKLVVPKLEPTEAPKAEPDDVKVTPKKSEEKKRTYSRVLWVSNVTQSVKASDLKQYLTKVGKVITAKIVTDGKKCYGYVVMDNANDAHKCLKTLNNAYFEGRKISFSLTRPSRTNPEPSEPDKPIDDAKNHKDRRIKTELKKRHRSRSLSSKISKRRNDPLTTKFDEKRRSRSRSRHRYQREKQERERLKRHLLDEQRKNREEMLKQIQREEKNREIEFKLEQDRRKLQLERELFEKERREMIRLDIERRKIERERLEILRQRTQLQEELEKSRKRKLEPNKFTLNSVIAKEVYEKPSRKPEPSPKPSRRLTKPVKESPKPKGYEKSAPPPPKLTNDFERKPKHSERKPERTTHKIEVIERKYYPGRSPDRKPYRKPEFDGGRKPQHVFPERKYEYNRDLKRYPEENYAERDTNQRIQWPAGSSVNYNDPWKGAPPGPVSGSSSTTRYQEGGGGGGGNFSASSTYGAPARISPYYYHPTPAPPEYPRYDHCSQPNGRKY